ncbi:hypothetical protein [Kordia sp.]|uniref:hypothetical protein n=1 Tax=Kordia sp. TaxID=1965332 RepID=UPI0025B8F994|nr:hypothetical protein [Kordia sp.]MCH2192935.1 hypothetical protein [Kordia sp.]
MKKINFAIVFLLFVNFSFSQDLAIKFGVNNFIYAGLDAPIQIVGCADFNEIEVTSQDAKVKKYEGNKYTLKAYEPGVIHVDIFNKKTNIRQSIPVAVWLLKPKVFLNAAGAESDNARRAFKYATGFKIKVYKPVTMTLHGTIFYDVTVIHRNKVFQFRDQEQNFSQNIKALFEILEKDDLVVFHNIRFMAGNVKEMLLDDLVFEIN